MLLEYHSIPLDHKWRTIRNNRRWGDTYSSPKNSCEGSLSKYKILQVVIPKNNKSHDLEKNSYRQAGFLKKVMHQTCFPPTPPPPPIISNASPSLKDTIMKDHRKGTHFPDIDIVTGLTMGSTTFEEVGVWWFRSGQEFFAAVRDFFFSCYCKYKTINCNCIFFPPSLFARNLFDHPA